MKVPGYEGIYKKLESVTEGKMLECTDGFKLMQSFFTCQEVIFLLQEVEYYKSELYKKARENVT